MIDTARPVSGPRSALDAEELKHLALKAMQAGNDDDSIRWLKDALELSPRDGELHHLLGMAHSHLGMVDQAVQEIGRALELAPGLVNARFQFGLLLFIQRQHARAHAAWQPLLSALADDHPLRLFSIGLTQLGLGEVQSSITTLEQGISLCGNERLNHDMRGIAAEARRYLIDTAAAVAVPAAAAPAAAASQHVLLAGYAQSIKTN